MVPMYLVDAFAERMFAGNPAAVCLLDRWPADRWLAAVAAEMQQAETAFLVAAGRQFDLRWFTPAVEVDLCGHATLASAAVLWHTGRANKSSEIQFATRSGVLTALPLGEHIQLDFPVTPAAAAPPPPGLIEALGVAGPRFVGRSRFDYLLEIESERALRAVAPDFRALRAVECRGVIVTAPSEDPAFDFVSRFFAPAAGVDEDSATGSAHCTLADYWHKRLGKTEFRAYQASARGAVLGVRLQGERVLLAGKAAIVLEGQLTAAAAPQ
ncbi:MAG: PhzF family phenazine biosynthesis protein [Pirellulales bacterium]